MAFKAKRPEMGSAQLPPAGTHVARCIQLTGLGHHRAEFQGKERIQDKIRLAFELPNELAVFGEGKDPEPFVVSREFTHSYNEKSALRPLVESWRAKPFATDEEAWAFDISVVVGRPCMITIVHKDKKEGGQYASLEAVTAPPKGMICPPQILKSVIYSVDMGRNDVFKSLPEWMQKKISECEEWKTPPPTESAEPEPEQNAEDMGVPF